MEYKILELDDMLQMIQNFMSSDKLLIQKAKAYLREVSKDCEAVQMMYHILQTTPGKQIRHGSALLLKQILNKSNQWNKVSLDKQKIIKQGLINVFMQEDLVIVRSAVGQVIGALLKHDESETYINEIWAFISKCCSSPDPKRNECGSFIFRILAVMEPKKFSPYIDTACEIFLAALRTHEAAGNMSTPVSCNYMFGLASLMPFIEDRHDARHTLQTALPLILKSLKAYAYQSEVDHFVGAFKLLQKMLKYKPKILHNDLKLLIEFCLEISCNTELEDPVRIKSLDYVSCLVVRKRNTIIKLKLANTIINAVFDLMVKEPEDSDFFPDDADEYPMTSAVRTMESLASNLPAQTLLPSLLALLQPLEGQNRVARRAAYFSMGIISSGCSETICSQHLDALINAVKVGITAASPSVRNAAFYALGQFANHLLPDLSEIAPQVMPIFEKSLQQLCTDMGIYESEPENFKGLFHAIKTFGEKLDDQLTPYLPTLMEVLFKAIIQVTSVRVRESALRVVYVAASSTKENMMPYLDRLITILQSFLMETDDVDTKSLQPRSIDTLAAIARNIGKENFTPLAADIMNFALNLLVKADDSDVRRSLYNLLGSLATVHGDAMVPIYPQIMQRMFDCIDSSEKVVQKCSDDGESIKQGDINDIDIDIEESEDMEKDHKMEDVADKREKEQAIMALTQFAVHTGVAFIPHLELSNQIVYKMIDHSEADIRKASISALCAFVITLYKHEDVNSMTLAAASLLPKIGGIVHSDEENTVVLAALEGISDILDEFSLAFSSGNSRHWLSTCILNVMSGRTSCQHNESEEGEDEIVYESMFEQKMFKAAAKILLLFGRSMTPEEFVPYFQGIYPVILKKLRKAITFNALDTVRLTAYACLAGCLGLLKDECGALFDTLCPVMLGGLSDKSEAVRKFTIYSLGELVLYSRESSYDAYPNIIVALYQAILKETAPSVLDNICGAISRMILTNSELVPLDEIIPVYIKHLPLREDFSENRYVIQSLETLYEKVPQSILTSLGPVLATIKQVISNNENTDIVARDTALNLFDKITTDNPELGEVVINSNPELTMMLLGNI